MKTCPNCGLPAKYGDGSRHEINGLRCVIGQNVNLRTALRQIQSACGLPDPVEACRVILKIAGESLGESK